MFKFSCFHVNVQGNKAKKIAHPSTESMVKAMHDSSKNQVSEYSSHPTSSNSSPRKEQAHKQMNVTDNGINDQDSVERIGRLEDLNRRLSPECYREIQRIGQLRKSHSMQNGLYEGIAEGDEDLGLSKRHYDSTISICRKYHDADPIDQSETSSNFEFQVMSGLGNDDSIFSIGDPTPSDKDAREISDTPLSGDFVGDSAEQTSGPSTPSLMKSRSLPNIKDSALSSGKCAFKDVSLMSRSSDDLHALGMKKKEVFINESDDQIRREVQERESNVERAEDGHMGRYFDDGFDSSLLSGLSKDWTVPISDDISDVRPLQRGLSVDGLSESPKKDFKIKRIEDWVIGLQHCEQPPEETNELQDSVDPKVDHNTINGVTVAGVDHKTSPGMEAAKRYISSMTANATAAQLANHGLVVIPFLSAFVSLKVLNLAGNAIVRITAGALPRGLHTLNLSKNNISTIEGLRELTRLRVLDLSYNRLLRIGHGLASCSSLKELYLAGNKIGEIEGLHRLLKLSILDLRFNKISTTKCLGQLAANYNSLQAINLDGNPCQKNVGDEQLKKHLQGLLPHLVYYNRQTMKAGSLKDGADRSVRLGMSSQQFDRSLRVDRKSTRKSSHGAVAPRRPSSSSSYRSQAVGSPKLSKGKQGHLPPIRTKASTHTRHHFDSPSQLPNSTSQHFMRKSRSEGFLGAL